MGFYWETMDFLVFAIGYWSSHWNGISISGDLSSPHTHNRLSLCICRRLLPNGIIVRQGVAPATPMGWLATPNGRMGVAPMEKWGWPMLSKGVAQATPFPFFLKKNLFYNIFNFKIFILYF
jgi:hypothetical protein